MTDKYISKMDGLLQKNRLLGFAIVVMLIFNIYNWTSLTSAKRETRVTVMPLIGSTGMWVGDGKASDEYIRAMARYITSQLGNYSAGTYRKQLFELLLLFPAQSVGQAQSEFIKLADEIERYPSISSYVQWAGETPLKLREDMIQVQVRKTRLVSGNATESTNSFYCIHYSIADTQFQLQSVEELTGDGDDLCINKAKNLEASNSPTPPAAAKPAAPPPPAK